MPSYPLSTCANRGSDIESNPDNLPSSTDFESGIKSTSGLSTSKAMDSISKSSSSANPKSKPKSKSSGKHEIDERVCDASSSSQIHPNSYIDDCSPSLGQCTNYNYSVAPFLAEDTGCSPAEANSLEDTTQAQTASMKLYLDGFDAVFYCD